MFQQYFGHGIVLYNDVLQMMKSQALYSCSLRVKRVKIVASGED